MPAAAQKPEISEDEVRRWLRENYSIKADLEPLPGECDLNFKLGTGDGETFVCKISPAVELELLDAQNGAMTHLNQKDLAAIPKVIKSKKGELLVRLDNPGQTCVGRVLTFVPGDILAKFAPFSDPLMRNLGDTVGRMNQALAGYDHAEFHYKFDWDLANSMEVVERYRDLIPDRCVRDAVCRIDEDFRDIVAPRLGRLRKSVIHNDANDYNVLAEGDQVTGIIDFGDMVYTFTICDLAIAIAYACLGANDISRVIKEMAIGYHGAMPIGEEELAVLFPMMRMRLAVSACMAAHQMRLRPGDPYLSISQEPIRKTLPMLMALDVNDVHSMLEDSLT